MSDDDLLDAARGAVVVGVDASDGARRALIRALEEGEHRDLPVLTLTAYASPSPWSGPVATVSDEEDDEARATVQRSAQRLVDDVVDEQRAVGLEAPKVRVGLRTGAAADVLVRLTRHAEMLVVGRRDRGMLPTRLTSSVTPIVATHAECPVLVV